MGIVLLLAMSNTRVLLSLNLPRLLPFDMLWMPAELKGNECLSRVRLPRFGEKLKSGV